MKISKTNDRFFKKLSQLKRIMKLACVFFIIAILHVDATVYSQTSRLNVQTKDVTVKEVFKIIEDQSEFRFYYNDELNCINKRVNVNATGKTVQTILNEVLNDSDLTYKVMENNLIIITPNSIIQGINVTGVVKDDHGESIPGVNILVKGTLTGSVTDMNGTYSITVPNEDAVLVFSFIGYTAQDKLVGNQRTIHITLTESTQQIEEVVVTALGVKREEKSLGYAVQNVSGNTLQTIKGVDMTSSLTGKVAGLVIKNTTEFNGRSGIEMRGETPLLVINGVPYGNMTLRDIPADEIEDITTLKGATAAALYGSRGSAGAVMITTKRGKEKGLSIDVNSNTMFRSGWVAIPKAQTS